MSIRLAVVVMATIAISGCSNSDKELAARQGDGSETFKFKPSDGGNSASASAAAAASASKSAPPSKAVRVDPKDSDGSDTFVYKPDPRLLKQLGKDKAK